MTTSRPIRAPLWATLLAALVAAMASYFVFAQSGEAAPAADGQPSPKIINGEPVPKGKYPFMAALIDLKKKGTFYDKQNCGGSLIDKTHVLTAGHCVATAQDTGPPALTQKPQDTQVIVGRTALNSDQGKVRNVKDIDFHPAYKGNPPPKYVGPPINQSYDVAVLTLSRPVSGIEPIELATSKQNYLERPGRDATVAGWGSTIQRPACGPQPQPAYPYHMREGQVPIISDSRAKKAYQQLPQCANTAPFVPRLMIAAGGAKVDTCQADSGGPLFIRTSGNDENGGKFTQIGVTSYGPGCATDSPGTYTEVNAKPIASFIASFIERVADGDGDNGDDDDNGDGDNGDDN